MSPKYQGRWSGVPSKWGASREPWKGRRGWAMVLDGSVVGSGGSSDGVCSTCSLVGGVNGSLLMSDGEDLSTARSDGVDSSTGTIDDTGLISGGVGGKGVSGELYSGGVV